jgi:hypothetical protein
MPGDEDESRFWRNWLTASDLARSRRTVCACQSDTARPPASETKTTRVAATAARFRATNFRVRYRSESGWARIG